MAIKLIIDSASDINKEEAATLGVTLVSMEIRFGEEVYLDGVDLYPKRFYEKLIESDELPKTSQINPFRFGEAFEEATKNGDEAVVITISSKLSGTYESAKQAAGKFAGKVFVVDSMNACVGERLLCQYALRLISEGFSAQSIAEKLEEKKNKINVMAVLGTLEYLKKGGRISAAVAFAGNLLSIKPVIAVEEGEVRLVGKAMGSKKGNNLLTQLVEKKGGIDFSMPYGVVWSGADRSTLDKYVQDSAKLWEGQTEDLPAYMIGCTIGTHVGPGAIGVAFFEK
ncbi:MAG: DegV family protein [Clostridia bacterium]|nr:DegV family protein [Clostridia bacterium]